ncbi:nucleotidyltransferase substrate binding protein [Fusibacter ferrireducens]|uniref:Nucleotidyltransferase substrate binding protein n=1 Tax=Fusibacter ferrireducens TaxID=2785058 RepID=A0ABR9ZYX2_9FIRM|nr:nucleotidyltransferase substrate binding protein [Fusibacter ferrireducens]MBF4695161.1 nucleotidyltransferase substrate binding protein [Fusibacter ferrireducens]
MDVRWKQRFDSYKKALSQLKEAIELMSQRPLSNLEKQGVVQAFEFTHELSWNLMKDFLEDRGNTGIYGSRDVTRQAFKYELIVEGDIWMNMIKSRNLTSHTYDETTVDEIIRLVSKQYLRAFIELEDTFLDLMDSE